MRSEGREAFQFMLRTDDGRDLNGSTQEVLICGRQCEASDMPGSFHKRRIEQHSFSDNLLEVLDSDIARWFAASLTPGE